MKNYNLLLGFSALLHAQSTVTGTVHDMSNHKGVSVYVPELHKGTTTDENGKYSLSNPNGIKERVLRRVTTVNKTIKGLQQENTLML
jgi:iron complex outermembrane receptor protein